MDPLQIGRREVEFNNGFCPRLSILKEIRGHTGSTADKERFFLQICDHKTVVSAASQWNMSGFTHAAKKVPVQSHNNLRTFLPCVSLCDSFSKEPYIFNPSQSAHTHAHTRTYTHAHTHVHTRTHGHAQTRTHAHTQVHTRTHAHTHTRTHAHTHTHTHARTHACTHPHEVKRQINTRAV